MIIDGFDDALLEFREVGIDGIGEEGGEDDEFGVILVDFFADESVVDVIDAVAGELVSGEEIAVEGLEEEATEEDESGLGIVGVGHEIEGPSAVEFDLDLEGFFVAEHGEADGAAEEFAFGDFGHGDAFAFEFDHAVAGDGEGIDGEEDIADEDFSGGDPCGLDTGDDHSAVIIFEAEGLAEGGVEGIGDADGEIHVAVVVAVFDVFEEVADHGGGDHVADILGDIAGEALESDADDFGALHDGAAAIAWVDGGIDLDGEMGIDDGVGVGAEIDAGNDPLGDAHAIAADGVPEDRDRGFEFGDPAEGEGFGTDEESGVLDLEDGEIAVVGDVFDSGEIFFGIVFLFDREEAGIADHVGIGEESIWGDHPTGTAATGHGAGEPRDAIIGFLGGVIDAGDAFADFVGLSPSDGGEEEDGGEAKDEREAEDHAEGKMVGVRGGRNWNFVIGGEKNGRSLR